MYDMMIYDGMMWGKDLIVSMLIIVVVLVV
jgi:hypothetical protein